MRLFGRRRREQTANDEGTLQVGDPRFDDWEVVHDYEDLATAQAWRQHLAEAGLEAVITSDWPLDRFGRGDIALRVPPEHWSEAEEFISGMEEPGLDEDL
jgi:hypothetical protein